MPATEKVSWSLLFLQSRKNTAQKELARSQLVTRIYSAGLLAAAFHHHIDWDRIYLLYKPQEKQPFDLGWMDGLVYPWHWGTFAPGAGYRKQRDDELKSFNKSVYG